ncbi:MAG: hypothetical protein HOO86_17880 [Bacteroidales bacterium]|nr:hypothetical protein [Bacteroidales bacterium]
MASKQLYIFVTSNTPDIYINAIRHCYQNDDIGKDIFFISIFEDNDKRDDAESYLNEVINRINSQIKNLSNGTYFSTKEKNTISIDIKENHKSKYAALLSLKFIPKAILYNDLEKELKKIINRQGIFDVTGFQKDYLIDVYTLSHILENSNLYYFKIKKLKNRTYDESELIHNLFLHNDYEYENISESHVTFGTSIIKSGKIEELNSRDLEIASLIDGWATSYAKIITNIFRALIIIPIVVFIILFLQNIESWNKIEPWTFLLLAPAIWVLNLFFQIFSGKNMGESLKINNLYNWLKYNKISKISGAIKNSEK